MKKRGQVSSLDIMIAVSIFMIALVMFYYFYGLKVTDVKLKEEAEDVGESLRANAYFDDNELSSEEIEDLVDMNCSELKEFFGTSSDVCMYAVDSEGNIIKLNGTKYAVGCPGLNISGESCG